MTKIKLKEGTYIVFQRENTLLFLETSMNHKTNKILTVTIGRLYQISISLNCYY